MIKILIKQIFVSLGTVWKYKELFDKVKNYPNNSNMISVEVNTNLISEDHFIIALYQLVWNSSQKFIEPNIIKNNNNVNDNVIDKLYDTNDKIIILPGGQSSVVMSVDEYYILFPVDANYEPIIDIELPYRIKKEENVVFININNFMQTKHLNFDYSDKKRIFHIKYSDIAIENMQNIVCEYGTIFHIKFLEECIEYVFRAWTDPNVIKSDLHEFYFKMLYYYDTLSLVMWAYTTKPKIFKIYAKYAIPMKTKDIKLKTLNYYEKRNDRIDKFEEIIDKKLEELEKKHLKEKNNDTSRNTDHNNKKHKKHNNKPIVIHNLEEFEELQELDEYSTSGILNNLVISQNRTSNTWLPKEFRDQFNRTLEESLALFLGKKKRNKVFNRVAADLLPIGHFIDKFPKIINPDNYAWEEIPDYIQPDQKFVENDIIIGFDSRSENGVHVRFKLRQPIQKTKKQSDMRLVEKGTVCSSKSKPQLIAIAKKLDVILPTKLNVENLCTDIRSKLIRLEIKERIKNSNIKWFYFHYEKQFD